MILWFLIINLWFKCLPWNFWYLNSDLRSHLSLSECPFSSWSDSLQTYHISSSEHEVQCLWPLSSEPFLWFTWLYCVAMVSPIPKDPTPQTQQLWCSGSGRKLWWCSATQEWVWTHAAETLAQTAWLSDTVPAPVLQPLPEPWHPEVSLCHTETYLSQLTGMCLSCGHHARYILVAHCMEVCWRKGHWVICTLVPPNTALDTFSHDIPTSEKPSCSSSTASTTWCPASLPDTSFSSAKFTAVSF